MAHTLTINGVSESWNDGSLNITEEMNSRNTIKLRVRTANTILIGHEIIVLDGATKIFAGTINSYDQIWIVGENTGNRKVFSISGIDYNQLLDKGVKVAATYENQTIATILADTSSERAIGSLLAAENITLGTVTKSTTVIKKAVFNYISVSEALNYIKHLTALNWNVDYDKELTLTLKEDNIGSIDSSLFYTVEKKVFRQQYRNKQILRAGRDVTAVQTLEDVSPKPDGISRNFILRYPVAKEPTITIDSVAVASADVGINGLDVEKEWYYSYGSKTISQDASETVLSDIQTLQVTYQGLRSINVQAQDESAIATRLAIETGSSGIYETVVQKKEIDDADAAGDYVKGLLLRYSEIPERIYITSSEFKQSGLIVNLSETKLDISGQYLIEIVNITETGGEFKYSYNLASGEALGSWVEFFRELSQDAIDYTIQENEVLIVLLDFNETIEITETLTLVATKYLSPATDLYYLSGDIPYSGIASSEVII